MMYWSLLSFFVAVVAALIAFGGTKAIGVDVAKVVFAAFLFLFVLSLLARYVRRGSPPSA